MREEIKAYMQTTKSCTTREVADVMGISVYQAQYYLAKLQEKGEIVRSEKRQGQKCIRTIKWDVLIQSVLEAGGHLASCFQQITLWFRIDGAIRYLLETSCHLFTSGASECFSGWTGNPHLLQGFISGSGNFSDINFSGNSGGRIWARQNAYRCIIHSRWASVYSEHPMNTSQRASALRQRLELSSHPAIATFTTSGVSLFLLKT